MQKKSAQTSSLSSARAIAAYVWAFVYRYRQYTIITFVLVFFSSIASSLEPYIYKRFIEILESSDRLQMETLFSWNTIVQVLLILLLFRVIDFLFYEVSSLLFSKFQARALRDIDVEGYDKIHSLSYRFHASRKSGSIHNIVRRGRRAFERLTDSINFGVVPLLFRIPFLVIMVAVVQGWTAFYVAIFLVGFLAWSWFANERVQRYEVLLFDWEDKTTGVMLDSILNFEAVKAYGRANYIRKTLLRYEGSLMKYTLKTWAMYIYIFLGNHVILACGIIVLFIISVQRYLSGVFSIGDIVLLGTLVASIAPQLYNFSHSYRNIRRSGTEMLSLINLHKEQPEIVDKTDAVVLKSFTKGVGFHNVVFGYRKGTQIIRGISFDVPRGTRVALVGHSGAGKSTLVKLLLRFYDVVQGRITVDGHDVRDVTQKSLRSLVSVVPQDPVMFHDTVYNNILFGRPTARKQDVTEAAKRAGAHEFIQQLHKGYHTIVGERGVKLSGGERQRVAIARALVADTPIVLLDEATSSLDSATELRIQYALAELMQGRTTFTVAHRLSTIRNSDIIVVMDKGKISDIGTHDELLKRNRLYKELWTVQVEGFVGG